jgi:uncharacterized protein
MKSISKVIKKVLPIFALGLVSTYANSASFDCSKAAQPAEKKVCSTPALSQLDDQMFQLYSAAKSASSDPEALKQTQISWIKEMRSCGVDEACMTNSYKQRIAVLTPTPAPAQAKTQNDTVQVSGSRPSDLKTTDMPVTQEAAPAAPAPIATPTAEKEPINQKSNDESGPSTFKIVAFWLLIFATFFGVNKLFQITEKKNEALQKIYSLIWNFVRGFSNNFIEPNFELIRGEVIQVGGYEKNSTIETTIVHSTNKYVPTTATTREKDVTETVSILQIGSRALQGVQISTKAIWDSLNIGDEVCCVFGKNSLEIPQLFWVHSFTKGVGFGSAPSDTIITVAKWVCALISIFALNQIIKSLFEMDLNILISTSIFVISFLLFSTFRFMDSKTNVNWDAAFEECKMAC